MNVDKFPGPDRLTAELFKDHWNIVKSVLVSFIQLFFCTTDLDHTLNRTNICLIPKIDSPTNVKDYRPISLSNVAYKILSKVLAERLKPFLHQIISENQTAFIQGRLITDNVLIAHELLHSMHTRKITYPFMALKLDISKAFDRIEWSFLEAVMKRLGFAEKWCNWIMSCVKNVFYPIQYLLIAILLRLLFLLEA